MNVVILGGTVDTEPEVRSTTGGKSVGSFRIDTGKGWFTVTAWEDLAANLPAKGTYVVVNGRLNTRSYENKDKVKVYVTEVNASTITPIGTVTTAADAGDDLGFG